MTDDIMHQQLARTRQRVAHAEVAERPALYLPWSQRVLNPFPLASSGSAWGDTPQPWAVVVLSFDVTVNAGATSDGSNYWTLVLVDDAGSVLASLTTAAVTAGVYTRLSTTTITQPGTSNARLGLRATATGTPGGIFLYPSVALLRSGS